MLEVLSPLLGGTLSAALLTDILAEITALRDSLELDRNGMRSSWHKRGRRTILIEPDGARDENEGAVPPQGTEPGPEALTAKLAAGEPDDAPALWGLVCRVTGRMQDVVDRAKTLRTHCNTSVGTRGASDALQHSAVLAKAELATARGLMDNASALSPTNCAIVKTELHRLFVALQSTATKERLVLCRVLKGESSLSSIDRLLYSQLETELQCHLSSYRKITAVLKQKPMADHSLARGSHGERQETTQGPRPASSTGIVEVERDGSESTCRGKSRRAKTSLPDANLRSAGVMLLFCCSALACCGILRGVCSFCCAPPHFSRGTPLMQGTPVHAVPRSPHKIASG